ncbi:homoserine kinase [Massilia yuzhufengensis]|uniref:Homoserine kinase n=1 Tax=Massilia yuzhufengensis TaxID=1164594 RepID=A0A1I1KXW5_9BURK|nr:homoserine kinase [Massilia yuzhufengensis]SFC65122.1 homoserine kinase [Massilia yuzhufengensis]
MAVFTAVTLDDLSQWIKQFPLGDALALQGISSGIDNSNFFLTTERGEFVLTIFENLGFEQLPFYVQLMRHLAERGIPVPAPVPNASGELVVTLHGKPAIIVSRLNGASQMDPQPVHCAEVGTMLARMHLAGRDFPMTQPNLRGLDWITATAPQVLPFLSEPEAALLRNEVTFQGDFAATQAYGALARGPVHADLFRNNVMFEGERLTGCFDFYFAGVDTWLFDVAVTVNDWCIDLATGELDEARVQALLAAYHAVRRFTAEEQTAWQAMLRAGALRFWLSRLYDFHLPRAAEMLTPHDPTHFERILRERIARPAHPLPV